jgi:hypothetical protein
MKKPRAVARIRWLPSTEGGRMVLPSGPCYAANVLFEGEPGLWSIVLLLPQGALPNEHGVQTNVELGFFASEEIDQFLRLGKRIVICEGPERTVAEGQITAVLE